MRVLDPLPEPISSKLRAFERDARRAHPPAARRPRHDRAARRPAPVDLHYRLAAVRRAARVRAHGLRPGQRRDQPGAWWRARSSSGCAPTRRCWTSSAASAISRCRWRAAPAAVVGVEGDAGLIERARANARRNGIDNAEFHVADLSVAPDATCPGCAGRYHPRPARPAAGRVRARCCRRGTSCTATGAVYLLSSGHSGPRPRNADHEHGLPLAAAGVLDMFPHTTHVESVAVLDRARR